MTLRLAGRAAPSSISKDLVGLDMTRTTRHRPEPLLPPPITTQSRSHYRRTRQTSEQRGVLDRQVSDSQSSQLRILAYTPGLCDSTKLRDQPIKQQQQPQQTRLLPNSRCFAKPEPAHKRYKKYLQENQEPRSSTPTRSEMQTL